MILWRSAPSGLPSATDVPAATLGCPLSELAVSNDLGMEPEVRVNIEVLDDPNVLIVGPVKRVSDSPHPKLPSAVRALQMAVAVMRLSLFLAMSPSAQLVRSMVSQQSSQTALLTPGDFHVVMELLMLPLLPP